MEIKELYETTELTIKEIADLRKVPYFTVFNYVKNNYSKEYRVARKRKCYRNSKLGDKNPMSGKFRESHPNYKGEVSDNKGYLMVLKPEWYTGRKNSKHVFKHSVVVCENLGITEIPKGWAVHHCDFNPLNNSFDNLVLIRSGDHSRLHRWLEGVTTISKESTLKWVEAHGTVYNRDDIVCST